MEDNQYYIKTPDKIQEGPYTKEILISLYKSGKYPDGSLVWREGMDSSILIQTYIEKELNKERQCSHPAPFITPNFPDTPNGMDRNFRKEYYIVNHDGVKKGPYSIMDLRDLVGNGGLYGSELTWKEGMPGWITINDVLETQPISHYMDSLSWIACSLFVLLIIVGFVMFSKSTDGSSRGVYSASIVSTIISIISYVFLLIKLFGAWKVIQNVPVKVPSAAQAVGFLFIPFFSFYWVFVAFCRVSYFGNKLLRKPNIIPLWPFLLFSILIICRFFSDAISRTMTDRYDFTAWGAIDGIFIVAYAASAILVIYYINVLIIEYKNRNMNY